MRKSTKFFGMIAVAGMIAASGSAFTATNTVAASSAGSGTTPIGAYNTTDIQYNPSAADPTMLANVVFTLDKTADYVAMRTNADATWVRSDDTRVGGTTDSCTSSDSLTWTCDLSLLNETVAAATDLSVVATS